jgi:hypothetical protein
MQATPNTVTEISLFLDQRTDVPFADLLQCQLKRWDWHSQDDLVADAFAACARSSALEY